ncbi:protein tramtrack, beta isoform-like [Pollicipes pollicipes]|uniref:protein tramtrack, beta isoform-like n=1 Tax=Pollicipes pollicipes TaxID=41117 RepID=UPI001884B4C5|nr:protein tramtrack, beta isoform-like [Pollicipes pollicipes]
MMNGQKFCLKWDSFRTSVTSVFDHLRQDEELVDITLCCDGHKVKAHRMMLSACSPYFRELLKENPCQHPVFFLKDTSIEDLRAVIEFVYKGEVNVSQGQLASFIKTAEMLQVRGLSGDEDAAQQDPAADERAAGGSPSVIKVEQVDLSEEDGELEAALGHVASFEGHAGGAGQGFDPAQVSLLDDSLGEAGPSSAGAGGDRASQAPSASGRLGCPLCSKTYASWDSYRHHLETHAGRTTCPRCRQVFATAASRNRHMGSARCLGARVELAAGDCAEYPCRFCGRLYRTPGSRRAHEHVHTGGTVCHLCSLAFGKMGNLKRHLRARHVDSHEASGFAVDPDDASGAPRPFEA